MKKTIHNLAILIISLIFVSTTNATNIDEYINHGDSVYITEGNTYNVYIRNGSSCKLFITDENATEIQWIGTNGLVINNDLFISTIDPGTHACYYKSSSISISIDIEIKYFVDIIDETPGSTTLGQTPDTVWIEGETATLSVGTEFVVHNWLKFGIYEVYSSDNTVTVPTGIWVVGCMDDDNHNSLDTIVVERTLSINPTTSNTLTKDVYICPNPARDFININGHTNEVEKIEIYNGIGQLMISSLTNSTSNKIDISMLHRGIYFVKIGKITKKIIKQ